MRHEARLANIMCIAGNIALFIIKITIGIITNSMAVMSDAMNSFMDSVTGMIVYFCMKISRKRADYNHPFGHHMAEPLAAMLIAVLTTVVGFEILHKAFFRLFSDIIPEISLVVISIYSVTIIIKGLLYLYTGYAAKATGSEALEALKIDHRNDILISISVILAFIGIRQGFPAIDSIISFIVAGYILKSGWTIGLRNIKYVMGESPDDELKKSIVHRAMEVEGVLRVKTVRAHYVGLLLNVEIHVVASKEMSLMEAHTLAGRVGRAVEKLSRVERAFVHVNPGE
jgi:cation diffusion facilitator family transporter